MGKTEDKWSSSETEANHLSGGSQEDRGGTAGKVGEDTGQGEEGGVGPAQPAANKALGEATWLLLG
jgi:hypothetical protein